MAIERPLEDFTVYLEGHDGHQGNVLVNAFLSKVHRIVLVFNKMERAFIESGVRRTDFEITAADKRNPTTLTLRPVARTHAYNPAPAFEWSLAQIHAVASGDRVDDRVASDIASDLVKLATKDTDDGYKAFWINGSTTAVKFDDEFLTRALAFARERRRAEAPDKWHVGTAIGSIVGRLKAVDDIDDEREFVIVPPAGPDAVTCTFPPSMREEMGQYLFKMVKVEGVLHYAANSPFPLRVDAHPQGISLYPTRQRRRTLREMEGVFAGKSGSGVDWSALIDG